MKILSAEYITSAVNIKQIPSQDFPEIAFAGRSNVGKSSLINCLINRKKLALTSSTPGKTRMLNYYKINEKLFFVDLPGYGYAKVSKSERKKWKLLIESYITTSVRLKGIIQLIDSRIGPTNLDLEMVSWLITLQKPTLIIATKIDKLPNSKINRYLNQYSLAFKHLGLVELVPFSAVTKQGKKEIWKAINLLLKNDEPKV